MRKSGLFYPIMLLACWTGLLGAGTFALLETTVKQYQALTYSTVQGRIVHSEVGRGVLSRRGLDLDYNYTIDGVDYTGHRYRYDDHNAALEWAATADEHPRWSSQTVYYNPNDPADSLLQPGIDGGDLLLLMFALPMNVLSLTLWRALITKIRELSNTRIAGGVRIVKQPGLTLVSLGDISAAAAGCYGLAGAAFVVVFPVAILDGFEPSMHQMTIAWTIVFLIGAAVLIWRTLRNLRGFYDLRIDKTAQLITLPRMGGRDEVVSIPRREVLAVSLQRRTSKSPSGFHFSYLPVLKRATPLDSGSALKLVDWGWSEKKAQEFARWLSEELGIEFGGIEDEISDLAVKS